MYREVIEHEKIKGFYKHPFLENIYVSKDGIVYNNKTERILYPQMGGQYRRISSLNEQPVHKLVCETFLEVPEEIKNHRLIANMFTKMLDDGRIFIVFNI